MSGILDLNIFEESANSNTDSIMSLDINSMTESEIHGKAPNPSTTGPTKHSGPSANKIEITSDVYNQALADIKKSFNESLDLLSRCVIVEGTGDKKKTLDNQMSEIYENALIDAFLEAADNGPIYESVKKENKAKIKSMITKLRSELSKKLDKSIYFVSGKTAMRNIEQVCTSLGIGLVLGGPINKIGGKIAKDNGYEPGDMIVNKKALVGQLIQTVGSSIQSSVVFRNVVKALNILFNKYTWQTVGTVCIPSASAAEDLKEITNVTSEILDDDNMHVHFIKVSKTISEGIISKFKYGIKKGVVYLIIVDNEQPPKELTVLSKPIKKVKAEDTKDENKKEDTEKDDKKEEKNVNESYIYVFDESADDIISLDI